MRIINSTKQKHLHGFTIVELLIAIVVIAILAAISIVAYTGIRQRAANTTIISAVNQSLKAIQAYVVVNDVQPYVTSGNGIICITTISGCRGSFGASYGSNAGFVSKMDSIASLPLSIPNTSNVSNGILYQYNAAHTFNGVSQPVRLLFWLNGTSQNCGVPNVIASEGTAAITSTTGYTVANEGGKTRCIVSVSGPVS